MKKWGMIVAVFALALSLTSCSRRRPDGLLSGSYGINYCDGTLGEIDVYTIAVKGMPDTYKVVIIPFSMSAPGDVVQIYVVNQSTLQLKPMLVGVSLDVDQETVAGYLSGAELDNYDLIAITSHTPGIDFLEADPEKDAICGLPLVGDGVQGL